MSSSPRAPDSGSLVDSMGCSAPVAAGVTPDPPPHAVLDSDARFVLVSPRAAGAGASSRLRASSPDVHQTSSSLEGMTMELGESLENIKLVGDHLGDLASAARNVSTIGTADSLAKFSVEVSKYGNHVKDRSLVKIGKYMTQLSNVMSIMFSQCADLIARPLEHFVSTQVQNSLELRTRAERTREEFFAVKLKYEQALSSKHKAKTAKYKQELIDAERKMRVILLGNVQKQQEMSVLKRTEVLEHMCTYTYSTTGLLCQGFELLQELQPSLNDLMIKLSDTRAAFVDQMAESAASRQVVGERQGFLLVKKSRWNRRWVVINSGVLYIFKSWKSNEAVQKIPINLVSIRRGNAHRRHTFSIQSPPDVKIEFQCSSEEELDGWVDQIESCISKQLTVDEPDQGSTVDQISEFSAANKLCADCGQTNPMWACVNVGSVVCQSCAGVLRQAGTHVRRIRSLNMDQWTPEQVEIMRKLGNDRNREVFEHNKPKPSQPQKPTPDSERSVREAYIRAKYDDHLFLNKHRVMGPRHLLDAIAGDVLVDAVYFFARGLQLDYKSLCRVVSEGKASPSTFLFVVLNSNPAIGQTDDNRWTLLHVAAQHNRADYARILLEETSLTPSVRTVEGMLPRNVAEVSGSKETLAVIDEYVKNNPNARPSSERALTPELHLASMSVASARQDSQSHSPSKTARMVSHTSARRAGSARRKNSIRADDVSVRPVSATGLNMKRSLSTPDLESSSSDTIERPSAQRNNSTASSPHTSPRDFLLSPRASEMLALHSPADLAIVSEVSQGVATIRERIIEMRQEVQGTRDWDCLMSYARRLLTVKALIDVSPTHGVKRPNPRAAPP